MTKASAARALFALLAIASFLFLMVAAHGWQGYAAAFTAAVALSALGELAFRKLASPEERRADLEERVRNPPS